MPISDEANATVKKMVFDRFKPGKIHDIRLELSFDSFGDECIRVHMLMDKSITADDLSDNLMEIHDIVIDAVDDDLKDLFPVFDIQKAED